VDDIGNRGRVAQLGHDLRTPLNGVMGMIRLLAGTQLDERQRWYVQTALTEADKLLAVIRDLQPVPEDGTPPASLSDPGLPVVPAASTRLPGSSILIVEDDPISREVARRLLTRLGYLCDVAEDGQEAVEVTAETDYDIVLMDCQMPRLDGYAATRAIREREARLGTARTPILALTAHVTIEAKQRVLDAGMDDFLTKPMKLDVVVGRIEHWLGGGDEARTDTPIFEHDELVDRCCGDRELAAEVVEGAAGDANGYLDELAEAVRAGSSLRVREVAHRLKGMSATLSAERVWHRAERLEDMGSRGELAGAAALVETLRDEVRRFFDTAIERLAE